MYNAQPILKLKKVHFGVLIFFTVSIFVLLGILLSGCQSKNYPAKNLTKDQTCNACGMIILNYPGPHAEIAWKNGDYTYYGNLIEVLPTLFKKAEKERAGQVWVQDFSGRQWGSYADKWIKAETAFYVVDGNRLTSMGIGYISFSKKQDAETFAKENGGYVLTYAQLTPAVLKKTHTLMQTNPEMYMPKGMSGKMGNMAMGNGMGANKKGSN